MTEYKRKEKEETASADMTRVRPFMTSTSSVRCGIFGRVRHFGIIPFIMVNTSRLAFRWWLWAGKKKVTTCMGNHRDLDLTCLAFINDT